jgi:hypothetical protein
LISVGTELAISAGNTSLRSDVSVAIGLATLGSVTDALGAFPVALGSATSLLSLPGIIPNKSLIPRIEADTCAEGSLDVLSASTSVTHAAITNNIMRAGNSFFKYCFFIDSLPILIRLAQFEGTNTRWLHSFPLCVLIIPNKF